MVEVLGDPARVLQFLETQRSDHPDGVFEMDMMQQCPELTLRSLRAAVEQLVTQGLVSRAQEGPRFRLALLNPSVPA